MRLTPVLAAVIAAGTAVTLVACGGEVAVEQASVAPSTAAASTAAAPAPSPTMTEASSPAPTPVGTAFVDAIDEALAPYSALIGSPASGADVAAVLPAFAGDVPLPTGSIVGAGRVVEQWGEDLASAHMVGLDTVLSKEDLEAYGAAAPEGWAYNSISTSDSSMSLVMTRESDDLRIVYMAYRDPGAGEPQAEFSLESYASEIPQPAWLGSLPLPPGGELTAVGEGIGEVEIDFAPALNGLATATWRFPADQLESLQEFYAGGALEEGGFTLVDPDAIRVGSSYFDVTAGDWSGQVVVGEVIDGDASYSSVQWFLTRD